MATTYEWQCLGAEIMDSRDLIAVAEEIREALDALDGTNNIDGERDESSLEALESSTGCPDDDEQEAREILAAIDDLDGGGIEDWQYGAAFIRKDYFEEYARELAEDIGVFPLDTGAASNWPYSHIDWISAAEALKQDYTEVDFRGTTYYVRA